MTREDFEEGRIYIWAEGFTKRCFRVKDGDVQGHYKFAAKNGEYWLHAKGWPIGSFYLLNDEGERGDVLRYDYMSYITPDDYFIVCLEKEEQL